MLLYAVPLFFNQLQHWRPERGASLTTYFVGACIRMFKSAYSSWAKSRERKWINSARLAEAPFDPSHAFTEQVAIEESIRQVFALAKPNQRPVLALLYAGYSQVGSCGGTRTQPQGSGGPHIPAAQACGPSGQGWRYKPASRVRTSSNSCPHKGTGDDMSKHREPTLLPVVDRALGTQERTARLQTLIITITGCIVVSGAALSATRPLRRTHWTLRRARHGCERLASLKGPPKGLSSGEEVILGA